MANKVYASPGVYTTEKDLTFTTETVGVTTLGVVGETVKGPAFQPIFIRNFDEFRTTFGGTNPEKFKNTQIVKYELPYIAKQYLTQSNQLYVTRLLGLSGYEAGMAWVVKTLGACDESTLSYTGITETEFEFRFNTSTNQFYVVDGGTNIDLIDYLSTLTSVNATEFDAVFNTYFTTIGGYSNAEFHDKKHAMYWGLLTNALENAIDTDATSINLSSPTFVDAYELPTTVPAADRDAYVLNNELVYDQATQTYSGPSFGLFCHTFSAAGASTIKGKLRLYTMTLSCDPYTEGHNKTMATIRSRGNYVSDLIKYKVETLGMIAPAGLVNDPYLAFDLTGTTANPAGSTFSYTVSLKEGNANYIKNVIGTTPANKDSLIYVEEVYDNALKMGWLQGKIKGLYTEVVGVNSWDHYKFQYQSPVTPFIVSELRGGLPQRLFRMISISDGTNANFEIKASIANVDLSKKTFDIYIRSFSDSDRTPVILERFNDCTMDESLDNYVGRKIGTIDNKYPLKSSYIVLELAVNAPIDGVPAGFEGYEFRTNNETDYTAALVPEMPYKLKYYAPGDIMFNPPFANATVSPGDRIPKNYLGFSSQFGFDKDLLLFKGKVSILGDNAYNSGDDYTTKTKGFHMDINAQSIVDSVTNEQVFATGVASFTDPVVIDGTVSHPYNNMRTRKFTVLFSGGFDGWDEYRVTRTNTDEYKIGRTGFVAGTFDTFTNVEYAELFGTSDYYATMYGIRTFQNPEEIAINILATPGIDVLNNTDLVRDAIEVVEEKRLDAIYLPTLPDIKLLNNNNPSDTESWYYAEDIVSELENTDIDSNYTAVYYPWIQITDTENNANLYIPPTAEVVRNLAYTDNVAFPWFATAGYNRGLVKCNRARIVLDQEARDVLYPGRINPLATYSDVGVVIWGNRNLQIKASALDRLNIRRLLLQARRLIMSVSKRLLFDPNDTTVRNQFLSLVNPILDNIRKERGLTDFRVSVAMDIEDSDRNTLRGKIFIKPTPTLEFIELEFTVTPQNVSFDNI
jgi:hypothetical protein